MTPIEYARSQRPASVERLREFLRIPSISTVPERRSDMHRAAEWVVARLRDVGLESARVDATDGHPVVFGSTGVNTALPTVLVYGHYDVQPPDPLELWTSPPFEPDEREGALYARGASDDKGQVMAHLEAARCYHFTGTELPVNLKFIVEGEEEIGSPNLAGWMREHSDELQADVAVVSDTAMVSREQPSVVYGLRGLAYMEIEVAGPHRDLHSGQFGGAVRNPANALCRIIASLHDADGRVAIPGFYDRVRTLSDDEREALAQVPFDHDAFRAAVGDAGGWGEPGYTVTELLGARPTLDVNGFWSGWTGAGAKTVLPATASAKVSMRLVPDQDPDDIAERFAAYVEHIAPPGVRVRTRALHGAKPVLVDRSIAAMGAAATSYERVYGRAPVFSLEGGSIPVVALLKDVLALDTVLLGFGLPDDNLHAPNEKLDLVQYYRGIETVIEFWSALHDIEGRP